jgi:hypothetical protein
MPRYAILAQSDSTARSLGVWLELLGEQPLQSDLENDPRCIVRRFSASQQESGVIHYETLVKQIEMVTRVEDGSSDLNEVYVIVDSIRPASMTAISEAADWNHLVAMLVLTFPEIKWVFGVVLNSPNEFPEGHTLDCILTRARRDPLLDPTGLREWVRSQTAESPTAIGKSVIFPRREKTAAAIDEEKSYAYFHGYIAYRYGFRADVITSWALMKERFSTYQPSLPHNYVVLLEDMSLNFPDRPEGDHILDLGMVGRAARLPKLDSESDLENSEHRLLVTSGQSSADHEVLVRNKEYLKTQKKHGQGSYSMKPVGGMIDFWYATKLGHNRARIAGKSGIRPGNAEGFRWPPKAPSKRQLMTGTVVGHGAPGRLMLVAETLLRRAEIFRKQACTVKDYIKGAVLAADAAELLSGLTPTLTYTAIALKHEYETQAECAFLGVGYHFDVRKRAAEIEAEVDAVSSWFGHQTRRTSRLAAYVVIMNRLVSVYRTAGQFEEEQDCLAAVRSWHRELQFRRAGNPILWISHSLMWYAEVLMSSFERFLLAVVGWIVALTGGWYALNGGKKLDAISGTFGSFFGGSAISIETDTQWAIVIFSCFTVAVGAFHIGILISFLYSLVSRK